MPTFVHSQLPTSRATGIATQTINTTKYFLGAEIDNAANLDELLDIEVLITLAADPVAGDPINIFILYMLNGANYEDGTVMTNDGANIPAPLPYASAQVVSIGVQARATAQRMVIKNIPLMPFKFKILVQNGTTKSCTNLLTVLAYGKRFQTIG